MKRKFNIFAVIAFAVGSSIFVFMARETVSQGKGARSLEGSWMVRLTPASGGAQFDEFMTFSSGGAIVESNNFPFHLMGLSAGPGHGTWRYDGANSFAFTFIKFLYLPSGQAAGTLKVSGVLSYSPTHDTCSGPGTVSICDSQGNNCNIIDVTNGQATRMAADSDGFDRTHHERRNYHEN